MKKLLFLAAAFVTGFAAMAQQKAEEVINVSADTYNFGKIKQGVPVTTYFNIVNISDKPQFIENAWAGCGCTTPEYSKAPFSPKQNTQLKVGYNAAAQGTFTKEVYVKMAGYTEPKVIKITGEVIPAEKWDAYTQTDEYKQAEKAKADAAAKAAKMAKKTKIKEKTH